MARKPIILGDFADEKYKDLSPAQLQKVFEDSRFYGLDGSVRPFAIGGSDVATIYGESPWNTPLDLYWGKAKKTKALIYEENEEAKAAGHRSENYIRKMFTEKSGIESIGNTLQARHPDYVHCVANVDGFVKEEGKLGIYEGKTTSCENYEAIRKWKTNQVPLYYDLQVRFYMGIWDLDFAYICCGWGLRLTDIAYVRIERDRSLEKAIFEDCEEFVVEIMRGKVPSLKPVKNAELVAKCLTRIYGHADPTLPPVPIGKKYKVNFQRVIDCDDQIAKLKEAVKEKNKEIKEMEDKKAQYLSPILEELKTATQGVLVDGNEKYILNYKPTGRFCIDSTILKEEFPEVYEKVYLPSNNRKLQLEKVNV